MGYLKTYSRLYFYVYMTLFMGYLSVYEVIYGLFKIIFDGSRGILDGLFKCI